MNGEGGEKEGFPYFPFKILRKEGRFECESQNGRKYELNKYAQFLLKQCDGIKSKREILNEIAKIYVTSVEEILSKVKSLFDELTQEGMMWWRKQPMVVTPPQKPQSVFWELTWKCNQRCLYCVSESGERRGEELTERECYRLIEELAELGVNSISFSGGEPLLHHHFFEISYYAVSLGMTIGLPTNGTLITYDITRRLREIGADVQITIEGSSSHLHDSICGLKGAFEKGISAVRYLIKEGISVGIATVVTTHNYKDIINILDLAENLGVNSFRLIPFIPQGRGKKNMDMEIPNSKMKDLVYILLQERKKRRIKIEEMEFEHTFSPPIKGYVHPQTPIGCGGARSYFLITATGEVLPCAYFFGVKAENIRNHSLKDIWQNSHFLNYFRSLQVSDIKGSCQNCEYLNGCWSGCKAANYAHGNLFLSNRHCWLTKEHNSAIETNSTSKIALQ